MYVHLETALLVPQCECRGFPPTELGVYQKLISDCCRQYLRCREDTIRCVINSLIDDGPSELSEELVKSENVICDGSYMEDDCENWETWNPDPVDADSC